MTPAGVVRGAGVESDPLVSVCMLALSGPGMAIECLDSVEAARGSQSVESVVVANGMAAADLGPLEERQDIVLVRSGTNLGFAGGNNLASRIARGRYLLFLNDDSTLGAGSIQWLLRALRSDPTVGAVGSRIVSPDGSLQEAGSIVWNDGHATHVGKGLPAGSTWYSYRREVDYASANGLMVRRRAFEAVGGFSEEYFPAYYEDADLCLALRRSGYRVILEPRAWLHHRESQSTTSRYRTFLMGRQRQRFVSNWSVTLRAFDQRPGYFSPTAIDRSIQRARGWPPRVLVQPDGAVISRTGHPGPAWEAARQLGEAGWAVTVACPGIGRARPSEGATEFLAGLGDLGVDVVPQSVEDVLATAGTDLEAIVAGLGSDLPPTGGWRQRDGRGVPVVSRVPPKDGAGVGGIDAAVGAVARRAPGAGGGPHPAGYPDGVVDTGGGGAPPEPDEPIAPIDPVDPPAGDDHSRQLEREVRALTADLAVRNEYVAHLEQRLDLAERDRRRRPFTSLWNRSVAHQRRARP